VTRIRELSPKAVPLYADRGRFLLEGARLSFFASRSAAAGRDRGHGPGHESGSGAGGDL
jgi:hypothetical protein